MGAQRYEENLNRANLNVFFLRFGDMEVNSNLLGKHSCSYLMFFLDDVVGLLESAASDE